MGWLVTLTIALTRGITQGHVVEDTLEFMSLFVGASSDTYLWYTRWFLCGGLSVQHFEVYYAYSRRIAKNPCAIRINPLQGVATLEWKTPILSSNVETPISHL